MYCPKCKNDVRTITSKAESQYGMSQRQVNIRCFECHAIIQSKLVNEWHFNGGSMGAVRYIELPSTDEKKKRMIHIMILLFIVLLMVTILEYIQ